MEEKKGGEGPAKAAQLAHNDLHGGWFLPSIYPNSSPITRPTPGKDIFVNEEYYSSPSFLRDRVDGHLASRVDSYHVDAYLWRPQCLVRLRWEEWSIF